MIQVNIFHKYHIVDQSSWPLVSSISAMTLVGGSSMHMQGYKYGFLVLNVRKFSRFVRNTVDLELLEKWSRSPAGFQIKEYEILKDKSDLKTILEETSTNMVYKYEVLNKVMEGLSQIDSTETVHRIFISNLFLMTEESLLNLKKLRDRIGVKINVIYYLYNNKSKDKTYIVNTIGFDYYDKENHEDSIYKNEDDIKIFEEMDMTKEFLDNGIKVKIESKELILTEEESREEKDMDESTLMIYKIRYNKHSKILEK